MATIAQTFQTAVEHHQAGRLKPAEQLYGQILRLDPGHADSMHLLGLIAHQAGQHAAAATQIAAAISLNPQQPAYHGNLGNVYQTLGRLEDAAIAFQRMIELQPHSAGAYASLGETFRRLGRYDEAIANCRRAVELDPNLVEAHTNLGNVLTETGLLTEAIRCFQDTLKFHPDNAPVLCALGLAYRKQGSLNEAQECYRRALELDPDYAQVHNNLGVIHEKTGLLNEAIVDYRRALTCDPECAEALNNLGNVLRDTGDIQESLACHRRALQFQPASAMAQQLQSSPAMHSNLLLSLNYDVTATAEEILGEHQRWGRMHSPTHPNRKDFPNSRDEERKLRIGYVSPDFRRHPVAYFMEPILAAHNHTAFDVYCYSDSTQADEFTKRMRASATLWRETAGFPAEQFAATVRRDAVDILVDLAGHTSGNRLPAFAEKLAPVQMTYLGYPNTSGLATIDYRVTDQIADPETDNVYTESLLRLPNGMACYRPPDHAPAVTTLPALRHGRITFGALHNLAKVNHSVIGLWSRVLQAVPESRLLIFHTNMVERTRTKLLHNFAQFGIEEQRLLLSNRLQPGCTHLDVYGEIDISLDAFPWSGHTTTCESLWMGVPMVTYPGARTTGRLATSALTSAGLTELIAHDADDFVTTAAQLTSAPRSLSELRASMRERLTASKLCDGPRVTQDLEAAYRQAWRRCHATKTA